MEWWSDGVMGSGGSGVRSAHRSITPPLHSTRPFPLALRARSGYHASAMLLTITSTQAPATDLGYLLHKSPSRAQDFSLTFGKAHVFYPEASEERCTAALLLEIDPVGLVRRKGP